MKKYKTNEDKWIIISIIATMIFVVFIMTSDFIGMTDSEISKTLGGIPNYIMAYGYLIPIITGLISLFLLVYIKYKVKQDNYSNEENSFYDKSQLILTIFVTLTDITIVIWYMSPFYTPNSGFIYVYFILILYIFLKIAHLSLIRKIEPQKNVRLFEPYRNEIVLSQLDEAELLIRGKASMKTMRQMYFVYFIVANIFSMGYGISAIKLDPLSVAGAALGAMGLIWVTQIILFNINSYKLKKTDE